MDDEGLLDISEEEDTIRETPMDHQRNSPATFSWNLVDHLGIIGHNNTGSETVNLHENQNAYISIFGACCSIDNYNNTRGNINGC